jgi:hypothetical protein
MLAEELCQHPRLDLDQAQLEPDMVRAPIFAVIFSIVVAAQMTVKRFHIHSRVVTDRLRLNNTSKEERSISAVFARSTV